MTKAFKNEVEAVFNTYPKEIRIKLFQIRKIILDVAASIPKVGEIDETIKWGEPSYLTNQTKSGSTIRLGWKKSIPDQCAIYFNCKTTLIDTFKEMFGNKFKYEGNRSILFYKEDRILAKELSLCISLALTYHLNKKK